MNPVYQNIQEVADVAGVRVTQMRRYRDSLLLIKSLGVWTHKVVSYGYTSSVLCYNKNTLSYERVTIHFYCIYVYFLA